MNDNDKQSGDNGGNGPNPWMKSLLIWVGILLSLAIVVTMFDGRTSAATGNAIAYSAFLDKVDEGTVKDVTISRDQISGTLSSGEKFRTDPVSDPQLTDRLRKVDAALA